MALISKKHLSMAIQSLQSVFNKKLKDSKADWNQNDSSADDYVKNRTHWEERKYQKTSLLDSIEHEFVSLGFEDALHLDSLGLVEGQTYTVSWDGKLYDCVAYIAEGPGTPSLGNDIVGAAGGTGGNGEPFFITDFEGCLIFANEVGIHTIEVTFIEDTTIIHKLDKKYLPDGISSKPDWEQNDENAADYIKNRPFYSDVSFDKPVIDETTVTEYYETDNGAYYSNISTFDEFVEGKQYVVYLDGASYVCDGKYHTDSYYVHWYIGNGSLRGDSSWNPLPDTGEPFLILKEYEPDYGTYYYIYVQNNNPHTFAVYEGYCKKIDDMYLPDKIAKLQSTISIDGGNVYISGDTYIGTPEESDKLATENSFYEPKKYLVVEDEVNGYNYFVTTRNGNLVSYIQTQSIEVTTMPIKTIYTNGDEFDPTGMVVIATGVDGSTREITNYTYDVVTPDNASEFVITYTELGITYTATISLFAHDFSLIDFEYIVNADGTLTLTAWKGTYNGEPSTKIIVPDSELIIV